MPSSVSKEESDDDVPPPSYGDASRFGQLGHSESTLTRAPSDAHERLARVIGEPPSLAVNDPAVVLAVPTQRQLHVSAQASRNQRGMCCCFFILAACIVCGVCLWVIVGGAATLVAAGPPWHGYWQWRLIDVGNRVVVAFAGSTKPCPEVTVDSIIKAITAGIVSQSEPAQLSIDVLQKFVVVARQMDLADDDFEEALCSADDDYDPDRCSATQIAAASPSAPPAQPPPAQPLVGRRLLSLSRRRSLSVAGGAQWDMRARLVNTSRRILQPPDLGDLAEAVKLDAVIIEIETLVLPSSPDSLVDDVRDSGRISAEVVPNVLAALLDLTNLTNATDPFSFITNAAPLSRRYAIRNIWLDGLSLLQP
ncbi:hypothetical protein EMIHUDRAFT_198606 [Emiliania huxleyi CCMP1516]|uniref:Uncharacterized protein n=2 Tax=Emiliania huxleyi TaxID=2903 RepID=A0A0D3I7K6_EMIH1|nr:hypothetical protein EMIHUDRAFT_198606 [Emiliania huxleyi CCMP1516]EOD07241.1 hypothetical protein EMIHUDRAFT_198606 [Emiliania huxleyi CCMP1516]|eukprot:XP_005759670.1 hypothetical protein EMIHUDRAFT_198606 [Emiliania huxleyi CCMP1516]